MTIIVGSTRVNKKSESESGYLAVDVDECFDIILGICLSMSVTE